MKTADLIDLHAESLCLLHLPFRSFGRRRAIAGPAQTVRCDRDNVLLRQQLETPGEGRVLVVDGAGATDTAILGDKLAGFAIANGWAGVVINGAIRDSAEIAEMDTLVFALATSPVKSAKAGLGDVGVPISLGGADILPDDWIYGDADGVLVSKERLA